MTPNVIIIVFDTLRRDGIQPYNAKVPTPNLAAFSKDANVFYNCIATSPWTLPSHVSIFTGLYPNEHQIRNSEELDLGLNLERAYDRMKGLAGNTLQVDLRKMGYTTYGMTANPFLSPASGFDQGFDVYQFYDYVGVSSIDNIEGIKAKYQQASAGNVLKTLLSGNISDLSSIYKYYRNQKRHIISKGGLEIANLLLNTTFEPPFMLFINFMEMHEPYDWGEMRYDLINNRVARAIMDAYDIHPYSVRDIQKFRNLYFNQEANEIDTLFGKFINHLKKTGIYDDSIIIVTSDHGQEFKEKGYYGHGLFLHDEIIKIPLMVKLPGNIKIERKDGYQGLAFLKDFIIGYLEGSAAADLITRDVAFSEESKRMINLIPVKYKEAYEKHSYINVNRKSVLKNGFKLTVNGDAGTVEEFLLNDLPVSQDDYSTEFNELVEEIEIFKGNEKFNLPHGRS
jgi:arylsulfatase A-like enzyme